MNTEYKVDDFIYNADIYDGLNNSSVRFGVLQKMATPK